MLNWCLSFFFLSLLSCFELLARELGAGDRDFQEYECFVISLSCIWLGDWAGCLVSLIKIDLKYTHVLKV